MRIDRANSALLIVGHESTVNRDSSARTPVLYPWLVNRRPLLGKKRKLKAGRRARELLPLSREPTSGLAPLLDLAKIYGWAGENDQALQQLATHGGGIGCFSYGELRLDPDWDSLRGDPRFEKMLPPSRQARTNSCHPERDRQSGSDRGTG